MYNYLIYNFLVIFYIPITLKLVSHNIRDFIFIFLFHLVLQTSDNTQESRRNLCAEQGRNFKIQFTYIKIR